MQSELLAARYPTLWHMADHRNLEGILQRGLLSTSSLLDLYEVTGSRRTAIESRHRPATVAIKHPRLGTAMIRDQKPMSLPRIRASLQDADPEEFFAFLNGRVFFWLTERRLATMNSARAYRDQSQIVLVVSTRRLLKAHEANIRLSPMNSGATSPFAHPRSIAMFRRIPDFDFEARRHATDPIAELTVDFGVPDIISFVERIEVWRGGERLRRLNRPYRRSS